jgi:hypothetical protein
VVPARSLQLLVGTTFLICWANSQGFPISTFYSPLSRTNLQNSGSSPSDEQMQFISKQFNIFDLISPYWVQSSVSLRIGRECDQDH